MALTSVQLERSQALDYYSEALKNTREEYLRLFQAPVDSENDKNSIWTASFVLQYMIARHEKYRSLLVSLNQDERALAVLGRLCDKLTTIDLDLKKNLQEFIDQAQKIMQGEEFKDDLSALRRAYNIELIMRSIGFILIMAASGALNATLFTLTGGLILISIPFFALECAYLQVTTDMVCIKRNNIDRYITSLATTEPSKYELTEYYYFETENDPKKRSHVHYLRKTHEPVDTAVLKESFFQSQMTGHDALNIKVQSKFNSLPKPSV